MIAKKQIHLTIGDATLKRKLDIESATNGETNTQALERILRAFFDKKR